MKCLLFTGIRDNNLSRPSGSYRIATHVRKHGWDAEVIDYFTFWTEQELTELIKSRYDNGKLKWIGFTATWTSLHRSIKKTIELIRKNFPDIKIIIGGHDIFARSLDADYYVNGYGEYAIEAVLKHAFSDGKLMVLPNKGKYYINALHQYPAWPMESYRIEYEDRDFIRSDDTLTVELSRGCRFACKFCQYPVLGVTEDNSRSEEDLFEEFNSNYQRFGVTNYYFADETVNDRDEKLEKLAKAVKRLPFKPNFMGFVRLDLLTSRKHQKELFSDANFLFHQYGIETFNHESGKIIGKGMHPDKIKAALLDTKQFLRHNNGWYRGYASLICGLPRETLQQCSETQKWFMKNWSDEAWGWYPLLIHKTRDSDDGFHKLSAFGEDFSKYGYRKVDLSEEKLHELATTYAGEEYADSIISATILWENDNMNMLDAIQFTYGIDPLRNPNVSSRLTGWQMLECAAFGDKIDSSLFGQTALYPHTDESMQKIMKKVEWYKQSKLNLK